MILGLVESDEYGEIVVAAAFLDFDSSVFLPESLEFRDTDEGFLFTPPDRVDPVQDQVLIRQTQGRWMVENESASGPSEIEVIRDEKEIRVISHPIITNEGAFDWGLEGHRYWIDFNSDGFTNFCRGVAHGPSGRLALACTLALGPTIESFYAGETLYSNVSYDPGPAWARLWWDVNANGWLDFCTVAGDADPLARCILDPGVRDEEVEAPLEGTLSPPRGWCDLDPDGVPDFCSISRLEAGKADLSCTLLFSGERFVMPNVEVGKGDFMEWVDVNLDGRTDFCTVDASRTFLDCILSDGKGFERGVRDLLTRSVVLDSSVDPVHAPCPE